MKRNWLLWLACGLILVATGLATAQVVPTSQSTFASLSAGRLFGTGAAPICASTGLGTGSAAIEAGSTDWAGSCVLSPTGAPGSSGTMTLTFTAASAYGAASGPVCTLLLQRAGAAFDARATIRGVTLSNTAPTFLWDNNAVALTAGTTYQINYICVGR
jgi:hypothetical protein